MKLRWENTKLYNEIDKIKTIFFEIKSNGKNFNKMINEYRNSIADPYNKTNSRSGAIFFAVYRGKVSEGINFSDNYCRSVIAIGIPYQNFGSYDVSLKLKYQDENGKKLSSRDWYSEDAFRSINQAVGRCIRHKYDYGSIILIDKRYNEVNFQKMLSKWYSKYLRSYNEIDGVINELDVFYSEVLKEELNEKMKEESQINIEKENKSLNLSISSTETPNSLSPNKFSESIKQSQTQQSTQSPTKSIIIKEEKINLETNFYPFKCINCKETILLKSDNINIEMINEDNIGNNHYIIQLFNEFVKKRCKDKLYVIKSICDSIPFDLFSTLSGSKIPSLNDRYCPYYNDENDENNNEYCYSVYDSKDECVYTPLFCKNCLNEKPIGVYNHKLELMILYVNSLEMKSVDEFNKYYENFVDINKLLEIDNCLINVYDIIYYKIEFKIYI